MESDKITFKDGQIEGRVVNPGGWFGRKVWLIGYPLGNFGFYVAIEADNEGDAIDTLADSEEFGHIINIGPDDDRFEDPEVERAGNDGHPVDLDQLVMHRGSSKLRYFGPGLPLEGLSAPLYYDKLNE